MGAFDAIPNILVPDDEGDPKGATAFRKRYGWEPYEVVVLKGTFTAGMQETIGNAMTAVDKKGNTTMNGGTGRLKLLECMIVDWTFTMGPGGPKVPIRADTIARLPANYSNPLLDRCDELAATMTEEEQEDFFGDVSEPLPESYPEAKVSRLR